MGVRRPGWVLPWLMLAPSACQPATEARVEVFTDLEPTKSAELTISTGPAGAETVASRNAVSWEQSGVIGSLSFVPPDGNRGATLLLRATLALTGGTDSCAAVPGNCVTATRRVPYAEGKRVRIPVGLFRRCMGVSCAQGTTCNYQGQCVSDSLGPADCQSEQGCLLQGDPPTQPGVSPAPTATPSASVAPPTPPEPPPAPQVDFFDADPREGLVQGSVSIASSTPVDSYEITWVNDQGATLGAAIAAGGNATRHSFLPDTQVPMGARWLEVRSVRAGARSQATRVDGDRHPRHVDIGGQGGGDALSDMRPFLDETAGKLITSGVDLSGRLTIRRCALDGSNCEGRVLDGDARARTFGVAAAWTDASAGKLYGYVPSASDGTRWVFECDRDGSNCVPTRFSNVNTAIAADVRVVGGRLLLLTQTPGTLAFESCALPLTGVACATWTTASADRNVARWVGATASSVVAVGGLGPSRPGNIVDPQRIECTADLSQCQKTSLATGCPYPHETLASYMDPATGEIWIARATQSDAGCIDACPLPAGTACKRVFAGDSVDGGKKFPQGINWVFPLSGVDVAIGVASTSRDGSTVRCSTTGCTTVASVPIRERARALPRTVGGRTELFIVGRDVTNTGAPALWKSVDAQELRGPAPTGIVAVLSATTGDVRPGNLVGIGGRMAATPRNRGGLVVGMTDPSQGNRLELATCDDLTTQGCSRRSAWLGSGNEGFGAGHTPFLARTVDDKTTVAFSASNLLSANQSVESFRCPDDTSTCVHNTIEPFGLLAAMSVLGDRTLLASGGANKRVLNCPLDGTACNRTPLLGLASTTESTANAAGTEALIATAAFIGSWTTSMTTSMWTCAASDTATQCSPGTSTIPGEVRALGHTTRDTYLMLMQHQGARLMECTRAKVCSEVVRFARSSAFYGALLHEKDSHWVHVVLEPTREPSEAAVWLRCHDETWACSTVASLNGFGQAKPILLQTTQPKAIVLAHRSSFAYGRPFLSWLPVER